MKKSEAKSEHIIYDSTETCPENEFWLDDEKVNLDKKLDGCIIAIADLGLWDGRKSGYRILGHNLKDILSFFGCDDIVVRYDGEDIRSDVLHHDGTNYILFREINKSENLNDFLDMIMDGSYGDKDIDKYTKSLGGYVKKIYGWD